MPFKAIIKIGTMVILWENKPEEVWELDKEEINKRLYKVVGLFEQVIQKKWKYGVIILRFNKEARPSSDLRVQDGAFVADEDYKPKLNHNQFNALIEGVDFKLTALGEIQKI